MVRNWLAAKINLEHGRVKIQHGFFGGVLREDLGSCQNNTYVKLKLSAKKTHLELLLFILRMLLRDYGLLRATSFPPSYPVDSFFSCAKNVWQFVNVLFENGATE